jgi:hypothetical protein
VCIDEWEDEDDFIDEEEEGWEDEGDETELT